MNDTSHIFRPLVPQTPNRPDPTSGDAADVQAMQAERDLLDEQIKTAKAKAARERIQFARAAEAAAREAHYARMLDKIGRPLAGLNEAQHAIIYAQAWEQGHASGYEDVENEYGELAEMARQLLAAN